ncbi:PrsW family intramembrane metalloprotease (plasmid) [Coraliomargarita sp. W4R53]
MTIETVHPSSPAGRIPAIWQPRQPVFWVVCILLTTLSPFLIGSFVRAAPEAPAVFVTFAMLLPELGVFAVIAHLLPQFRRQPVSLRLAALAWGGFVATSMALLVGSIFYPLLSDMGLRSLSGTIGGPLVEDTLRFLGIFAVLILAYKRRITVMDGVVYGFLVGVGFEVVENFTYLFTAGDLEDVVSVGFARVFLGFGLHAVWSVASGAVLAYVMSRAQRKLPTRWWLILPAILIPMLLHAAWDFPILTVYVYAKASLVVLLYAASVVLFLLAVTWGRRADFAALAYALPAGLSYRGWKALPRRQRKARAAEAVAADARRTRCLGNVEGAMPQSGDIE